jgi:membrane protein
MTSVELSFNRIYRARQGRAWPKRVILYWFVLTASPLLIAAIPILAALLHRATETPGVGWAFSLLGTLSNVMVLWALLGTVYLVVPAGPVRPQCAAIGAFVAAVTIIALKGALAAYFEHAFGMSALYGSLGLVPVFMFWMWVVWMAVLGGLEVSAIAQTVRVRGLDAGTAADDDAPADPMLAVAAMECAAAIWRSGKPVTRDTVAADLRIDDRLAGELLEVLVRGGFLFHTESDAYAPARPPATIRSDEVLLAALSRCAGEEAIERSSIAAALRATQLERARAIPVANARLGGDGR